MLAVLQGLRILLTFLAAALLANDRLALAEPLQPASAEPFTVSMKVEVQTANRLFSRNILPGERVRVGERFFTHIWADQPVYLYIVNYEPTDWSSLLFPETHHIHSEAGRRIRIPEAGGYFAIREGQGEVRLRVFASREPIDTNACRELRLQCPLFQFVSGTRGGAAVDKAKKDPPPPERAEKRTARDRGAEQTSDETEGVVSAKSDKNGTAWLDFAFKPEL